MANGGAGGGNPAGDGTSSDLVGGAGTGGSNSGGTHGGCQVATCFGTDGASFTGGTGGGGDTNSAAGDTGGGGGGGGSGFGAVTSNGVRSGHGLVTTTFSTPAALTAPPNFTG